VGWRLISFRTTIQLPTVALVPSPLGGMVTLAQNTPAKTYHPARSKPTVWDGNKELKDRVIFPGVCSEPTAWDGKIFAFIVVLPALLCSKPTGWDGDPSVLFLLG